MKRIPTLAASLAIASLALTPGCGSDSGSSNNGGSTPDTLTLATARIGQSGTFAANGDLLIGAPGANDNTGALLVVRSGQTDFSSYVIGEQEGDTFGTQVTALGDVVGDGGEYFAVSARYAEGAAGLSGAVYVYKYTAGAAAPLTLLVKLNGVNAFDKFGEAVAAGDFNGDAIRDIAVSAPFTYTEEAGFQSGRITVYLGGAGLAGKGSAPDATIAGDKVGAALGAALAAGDITDDGIDELFVTASSKVFIYTGRADFATHLGATPAPAPDTKVRSDTGGKSGSGFGTSLAWLGDVNGDGIGDFAVGNPNRTVPATYDNQGSVYIFRGATTLPAEFYEDDLGWRLSKILGENAADRFGSSIARADAGGASLLMVGARWATGTVSGTPVTVTGDIYQFDLATVLADNTLVYGTADAAQRYPIALKSGEYGRNLVVRSTEFFAGAPLLDGGRGRPYRKTIGASGSDDGSCCGG